MKKPIFKITIDKKEDQVQFVKGYLNNCLRCDEDWLFNFFDIKKNQYEILSENEKTELLQKIISKKYEENQSNFAKIKKELKQKIKQNYDLIIDEFERIFDVLYDGNQKYIIFLGVCPVCPRFLDWFCFNLCVTHSCAESFETMLHELTHFFWFDLFKKEFPNIDKTEYETPHLPWLVSEIVVDTILSNSQFKKFLVYKPSYDYFYETQIAGENLMKKVNKMYVECQSIKLFMHKVFDYLNTNKEFLKDLS